MGGCGSLLCRENHEDHVTEAKKNNQKQLGIQWVKEKGFTPNVKRREGVSLLDSGAGSTAGGLISKGSATLCTLKYSGNHE